MAFALPKWGFAHQKKTHFPPKNGILATCLFCIDLLLYKLCMLKYYINRGRLKSRNSFMATEILDPNQSLSNLLSKWNEWDSHASDAIQDPKEELPSGTHLPRKEWVTLNLVRTKVGKTGRNLHRWGLAASSERPCGNPGQTMDHILRECNGPTCTDRDFKETCTPV